MIFGKILHVLKYVLFLLINAGLWEYLKFKQNSAIKDL